jgi:hypothetical protein
MKLSVLALVTLAACSTSPPSTGPLDAGSAPGLDASDATVVTAGCSYPKSQGPSMACCPELGADACGASLFCAALDGRTQATCYANYSRLGGQTCTDDAQCASAACDKSGVCKGVPGGTCDPSIGCGTTPGSAQVYYCGAGAGGALTCLPCTSTSTSPVCGSRDAGSDAHGTKCVSTCKNDSECQASCPPVTQGSICCDGATGVCYSTFASACPH